MAVEWGQEEEKLVVKEGKSYGGLSVLQNASVLGRNLYNPRLAVFQLGW